MRLSPMKNNSRYRKILLLLLLSMAGSMGYAQQNEGPEKRKMMERFKDDPAVPFQSSRPYYLVQWTDKRPEGMQVVRELDDHSVVASLPSAAALALLRQAATVLPANDQWKLSPSFKERELRWTREQEYILSASNLEALLLDLDRITGIRLIRIHRPTSSVIVAASSRQFMDFILPMSSLIFADQLQTPRAEIGIIGYNRSFHGLSAVDYSIPNANGRLIVVGVKEQRMEPADLDLHKRVLPSQLAAGDITNHATVVSSIIGGAGNSFYDGRGIAWGCQFYSSSFNNLFADDASILSANKVTVQNHSYGTVVQSFYGAEALSYDLQTWADQKILHVFSAGNQGLSAGGSGPYSGISGFANLTGNFKSAKNVITVGAIDNRNNLPAESSSGPLYDGRLAPQLVALGPGGTSDAAAVVSGTAAVIQQVYADSNLQQIPPASLVKAVLFNSADDIFRQAIDYKTGFGLLNSLEAVKTIQQRRTDGGALTQGQQWIRIFQVPPAAAQLKVTLCWTDSAATVNNSKALVNDLDIQLTELSTGTVYRPWILNKAARIDSLSKPAVRGRDSLNTAEQISIALPAAGQYECKVTGTSILHPGIRFHIAYAIDTLNRFLFTSPQHSSDINREENPVLDIRWRCFIADTNQTGNLYISYNRGGNWELIAAGTRLYKAYYPWPVRDTSSTVQFRMETSFGNFFTPELQIHPLTRPVLDYFCNDSLRLSWKKHLYANGYKIFALTDSAYLRQLYTVTDTFTVIRRSLYPQQVFAVEPVLANGIPASRSIAFDVNVQGVKCFYKTFYHSLQDGNLLQLFLELSAPALVDSVSFELVSANGQFIRLVGSQAVTAAFLYRQEQRGIPQGTSYWRARIRLRSGTSVYTELIPVLSSGSQPIVFYPNPVQRKQVLNWVLEQGVPAGSRLQLYDSRGGLLADYAELPPVIQVNRFPPGVLVYHLIHPSGQIIAKGKILLQ